MPPLSPDLRGTLERAVILAREEAEKAAEVALKTLAVDKNEAFATHSEQQRRLRNALRAKGRQLGGGSLSAGFRLLVEEVAYEQWHRMFFARFLLENDLLMHPTGAAVSLEDCAELAAEEGESDPWQLAARYASNMLPGIFAKDDPSVDVVLPPEGRAALETIVAGLPAPIFTSDDGLGWVYQFWQSKRKKEVSSSGRKIAGMDLAAYSELFTEDYMVRFLLENSLGAWWAVRHPESPLVKRFTYLRFQDDGLPAAGAFQQWPEHAAEVTVMDPCCGSGHFLVVAFEMLRRMRMEEEGVAEAEAADLVLRDNLFGLELDPRCVQIAAFALALAAWKVGGYRLLPLPNIACSGIAVNGQLEEWTKLADEDVNLRHTLEQLFYLFRSAPDLGSLINPADAPLRDRMFAPDYAAVGTLLTRVLADGRGTVDPVSSVFGASATGVARAARLLQGQYTLVATNVPYLVRNKQGEVLRDFLATRHPNSQANLATAFVERCAFFASPGCSYSLVVPQNWLFLGRYERLRRDLLRMQKWNLLAPLGAGAFDGISGEVVNVALQIITTVQPTDDHRIACLREIEEKGAAAKADALLHGELMTISQAGQLGNPDARIIFGTIESVELLGAHSVSPRGVVSGDSEFWIRRFWELPRLAAPWRPIQSTVRETTPYGGRQHIINWKTGGVGMLRPGLGNVAYGRKGVAISLLGELSATLYSGELYDNNTGVIVPRDEAHVPAIWAYCSSNDFRQAVRQIDRKMNVTNATLLKVPFDLEYWARIAEGMIPIAEPHASDPTQWLFQGSVVHAGAPLQVAVARLLGYRWPQQDSDQLEALADDDGIVPLPAVAREEPAAERLRGLLATAYGDSWSPGAQEKLLNEVGFAGKGFDVWLRDGFFEQHCKGFHQRPFIWQIWDGRKDGFSALLNYHKLDPARLDKLVYTYLGEWIRTQRAARDAGTAGAEGRLVAALELQKKLEAIRDGEPPYDIYVRWKPLDKQPIGWNPDLDDGVRMNIRPFVMAGVLRSRVNVSWNKDRGLNPGGSERINDRHLTVAEKRAARQVEKS